MDTVYIDYKKVPITRHLIGSVQAFYNQKEEYIYTTLNKDFKSLEAAQKYIDNHLFNNKFDEFIKS